MQAQSGEFEDKKDFWGRGQILGINLIGNNVIENCGHGMGSVWAQAQNGGIFCSGGRSHELYPKMGEGLTSAFSEHRLIIIFNDFTIYK